MDQVLCKFEERFLEQYKLKYPSSPFIPLEQREGFWIDRQYSNKFGDNFHDQVYSIIEEKGFYRNLEPIENSIDAVKEINSLDDTVVFLCSSPLRSSPHSASEKFEWVAEHLGQDWMGRVILAGDKTMVHGHLLIDDKPDIHGCNKTPSWDHILYTSWGNCRMNEQTLACTHRLTSWADRDALMNIIDQKRKEIN